MYEKFFSCDGHMKAKCRWPSVLWQLQLSAAVHVVPGGASADVLCSVMTGCCRWNSVFLSPRLRWSKFVLMVEISDYVWCRCLSSLVLSVHDFCVPYRLHMVGMALGRCLRSVVVKFEKQRLNQSVNVKLCPLLHCLLYHTFIIMWSPLLDPCMYINQHNAT